MQIYTSKKFWEDTTYSPFGVYDYFSERLAKYYRQMTVDRQIVNPFILQQMNIAQQGEEIDPYPTYKNVLGLNRSAFNTIVTSTSNKPGADMNAPKEIISDAVDADENNLMLTIQNEAKIKLLQMYYDAYMAPMNSDIKWRLGPVMSTVLETDTLNDPYKVRAGRMYTRSAFSLPWMRTLWNVGEIVETQEFLTPLDFPPYKISPEANITQRSDFMSNIYAMNPEATFDQDSFIVHREGYTYRDMSFKALNDYISFLQTITENLTGIVSTHLTEWDLSIYMQEGLMARAPNGGPLKLYLNYRIREDNPVGNGEYYQDDRALVYNVQGSAVSKIDMDCMKSYRPSDYPLTIWWQPYKQDKHWTMLWKTIKNDEFDVRVPYMSIYDETKSNFPYQQVSALQALKHQDDLGAILGQWPNYNLKYFSTFYSTPADFLTEGEIETDSKLKKVKGADPSSLKDQKLTVTDFILNCKNIMLANGGYWGSQGIPGGAGGLFGTGALKTALNSDDEITGSKQSNAMNSSGKGAMDQAEESRDVQAITDDIGNKMDASHITKWTGINRFSPAIFGGPHGSEYNPNTVQGYFDPDNTFLRNIPRIDPDKREFEGTSKEALFTGNNKWYHDNTTNPVQQSPDSQVGLLVKGLQNYTIEFGWVKRLRTEYIEGKIEYNYQTKQFDKVTFPTKNSRGQTITYMTNEVIYKPKTIIRNELPFNEDASKAWQYDYDSYYNPDNITLAKYQGNTLKYYTIVNQAYKLGSYYTTGFEQWKNYYCADLPDVKWEIVQHKFEGKTLDNTQRSPLWKLVRQLADKFNILRDNLQQFNSLKYQTVFMLRFFGNDAIEKQFIQDMVQNNGGENNKRPFFFLEGNEKNRYTTGPESIFRANCSVQYYKNRTKQKFTLVIVIPLILFEIRIPIKIGLTTKYTYIPYIDVDVINSDYMEDGLNNELWNNYQDTSLLRPIHLKYPSTKQRYNDHILQKFKEKYYDLITAYQQEKNWGPWIGPVSVMFAWTAVFGIANSYTPNINSGDTLWRSEAKMGVSGIGILSQIMGLNPSSENIISDGKSFPFKDLLKMPEYAKSVPIRALPLKTHTIASRTPIIENSRSPRYKYMINSQYMMSYGSKNMDAGLLYQLGTLYTRCLLYKENDTPPRPGYYINIEQPVRNLLSTLLSQYSFFNFAKDCILEQVNFETLQYNLTQQVDRCVLKASGLNSEFERISASVESPFYDYWIERALNLFWEKKDFKNTNNSIKTDINKKLNTLKNQIDYLTPLCQKDSRDWSYNDITEIWNKAYIVKTEFIKRSILEDFLFSYLHLLYYYRFYFIAKRFNKENGTMWTMRQLEGVLDIAAPYGEGEQGQPISPQVDILQSYTVVFYELNNNTSDKHEAFVNGQWIEEDRISTVYTKVIWAKKEDFDQWNEYNKTPELLNKVPEVIEVYTPEGEKKYAVKPLDATYYLSSQEWTDNEKNKKWNEKHQHDPQRFEEDFDTAIWQINWGNDPDKTPIRWNVFESINPDNTLEYAKESVSPEELMCLIQEGADFWTIRIPKPEQPRKEGFVTKIKIKQYKEPTNIVVTNDAFQTLLGPFAYQLSPITEKQLRPFPGIQGENRDTVIGLLGASDGYGYH